MSRPPVVTSFWDAAEQPPGFEAPMVKFREMIRSSQQPASCSKVCRVPHKLYVGGTASNLRRLASVVLEAVLLGCALVGRYPRPQWLSITTSAAMRQRCNASSAYSLECYFLPVSTCVDDGKYYKVIHHNYDPVSGLLDEAGSRIGLRSELLIMGAVQAWIMRPQPDLADAVRHYAARLGLDAPSLPRFRRVGMHIRKGDKHSLYPKHIGRNTSSRISVRSFSIWGRRIASDLGAERVLFQTDDRTTTAVLGENASFFQLAPAPAECMPSYNAGILGKQYVRAAMALSKLQSAQFAASESGRDLQTTCGPDHFRDDGVQLFAGMLLLAQLGSFIGTQISNMDSTIVELMATQRHPPVYFDVLNDVHRSWISDEKVWYGGIHNHVRSLGMERLVNDDGTWTHGVWTDGSVYKPFAHAYKEK